MFNSLQSFSSRGYMFNFLQSQKGQELLSKQRFLESFNKHFSLVNLTQTGQISLPDCVCSLNHLVNVGPISCLGFS